MFKIKPPIYDSNGNELDVNSITMNTSYYEHCPFKNNKCNYQGRGWYDRCAWCKDNNGFIRINENNNIPY